MSRCARSLSAIPAGVLAAVLGAATAPAATTWTVRPGGPVSMVSGKFGLKDTTTGSVLTCQSSALSGTLKSGSGLAGTGIGSVPAVSFTNCTSPLGFRFILQPRDLPWHVNFSSYNAATGVVKTSISHLQIGLSFPDCTAVIDGTSGTASDGTIESSYSNGTGVLRVTGDDLHIYRVHGCLGIITNGNPVAVSATYTMSPKQAVTSP